MGQRAPEVLEAQGLHEGLEDSCTAAPGETSHQGGLGDLEDPRSTPLGSPGAPKKQLQLSPKYQVDVNNSRIDKRTMATALERLNKVIAFEEKGKQLECYQRRLEAVVDQPEVLAIQVIQVDQVSTDQLHRRTQRNRAPGALRRRRRPRTSETGCTGVIWCTSETKN